MQRYDEVAAPANFWDIQPKFVTNDMIKRVQSRIYSSFAERECHRAKLNSVTNCRFWDE